MQDVARQAVDRDLELNLLPMRLYHHIDLESYGGALSKVGAWYSNQERRVMVQIT